MNDKKAELVTRICKECQTKGFTMVDLDEIVEAVKEFYHQNARP